MFVYVNECDLLAVLNSMENADWLEQHTGVLDQDVRRYEIFGTALSSDDDVIRLLQEGWGHWLIEIQFLTGEIVHCESYIHLTTVLNGWLRDKDDTPGELIISQHKGVIWRVLVFALDESSARRKARMRFLFWLSEHTERMVNDEHSGCAESV